MKPPSYQFLAAASLVFFACTAQSATRPRVGGTLRIGMHARVSSLDWRLVAGRGEGEGYRKLEALICDRLVWVDARNQPRPGLAVSWDHDARLVRWRFKLRSGVKWHDGASLNPTDVLTALEGVAPKYRLRLEGDTLEINAGDPAPDLLAELATSEGWAIRRPSAALPGEPLIGTGPFRLVEWQPERRAVFHAHEEYWAGRPYVDRIEVEMGRSSRALLLDLELDRADLVELDPVEARRAQQEGKRVWTSASVKLLALRFASDGAWAQDSRLREAVARSVDRAAIQKVLLQNYGETASNIFPQWLSGYAFLFPVTADLERARQLKAEIGAPSPQRLGFDPTDPLARQVAERVAVNARDAGFSLQVAPLPDAREGADASSDLVILRRRIDGPTLQIAARQARRWFPFEDGSFDSPEAVYSAEKRLLDTFVVVPIVCIPEMVGLGPRVRNWGATPWGEWHLDEVWLEAERP